MHGLEAAQKQPSEQNSPFPGNVVERSQTK